MNHWIWFWFITQQVGSWSEDLCPISISRLVPIAFKLVLVNKGIDVSFKTVLEKQICVNTILYNNKFMWFYPSLGFHIKKTFYIVYEFERCLIKNLTINDYKFCLKLKMVKSSQYWFTRLLSVLVKIPTCKDYNFYMENTSLTIFYFV